MAKHVRVTNERKNLNRLAGEFLVASRLAQHGYMISLQWGTTIGYDILAFDKKGNVAFIEVKTTASHPGKWLLQKKFADRRADEIPSQKRFVCCVDLTRSNRDPEIFLFPASVVADGIHYFYGSVFSKSPSFNLSLDATPRRGTDRTKTVREFINADKYLHSYEALNIERVIR